MHCNLRPQDVAPVVLCFNYEALSLPSLKWVNQTIPDLWRFYCWHLTLRCDPLILNLCKNALALTRSNSVQNFSKLNNPRSNYSDWKIENWGPTHIGFHDRWISVIPRFMRTHNAPSYQIWAKSKSPRRSYCDFNMSNLGAVRHLRFNRK